MGVQPIAIPPGLAYVLNSAGEKSDVDFRYLLETAKRESSLDPAAKAPSSSAVGLFQFLDSTWLQVMKEEGPRLGYQKYADAITQTSHGDYIIKDKALRAEVLKLRENPQVAADMAAAFTRANGAYLEAKFGRMPSPGELYIAHFLGPQGAEKLFNAGLSKPDQVAAKLFPNQAKANPQIFYAGDHARTIREVYKALVAQHVGAPAADPNFVAQQLASGAGTSGSDGPAAKWSTAVVPSRFGREDMSFTSLFSTEAPWGTPSPLIGAEAAAPIAAAKERQATGSQALALFALDTSKALAAIDSAMSGSPSAASIGDPFSAPAPLMPLGAEGQPDNPLAVSPLALAAPETGNTMGADAELDPPRPRVLMTPKPGDASSAFLAQLYNENNLN